MVSVLISTLVCFSAWHKEALGLWNFNDFFVTNTGDVTDWREGFVLRAGQLPEISPLFTPAPINAEELRRCLSCLLLRHFCVEEKREQAFNVEPHAVWVPYNWNGADSPSLKPHNCSKETASSQPRACGASWSCSSLRWNYCFTLLFALLAWSGIQIELPCLSQERTSHLYLRETVYIKKCTMVYLQADSLHNLFNFPDRRVKAAAGCVIWVIFYHRAWLWSPLPALAVVIYSVHCHVFTRFTQITRSIISLTCSSILPSSYSWFNCPGHICSLSFCLSCDSMMVVESV